MHFAYWMCDHAEQDYWEWMRCREDEEEGDITVTRFGYHGPEDTSKAKDDPKRYGEFMCDWTIRTELGRISR